MEIEFDPAKDEANIAKHGLSLSWASSLEIQTRVRDLRIDYGEARFNAFGLIDGVSYCLTYTLRGRTLRAISLRRSRMKEYRRYVPS